jgi:hypothetical protein
MAAATLPTDRTTAVTHDTRLYELLAAQTRAWLVRREAAENLIYAAADVRVDYRYRVYTHTASPEILEALGDDRHRSNLPPGTVYQQDKTYTRGEAGVWVTYEWTYKDEVRILSRRATVADALERVPADHRLRAVYDEADAAYAAATEAVAAHETGYTGWNRYFLVTSSAGHVHRSMGCSTCKVTTTYAPVVDLSGTTDDEALEALGPTLCTVCFPEAPVGPTKISKAAAARLLRERGQ